MRIDYYDPDIEDDEDDEEEDVEEVRERLRDYYGSAMFSGFPMAVMDLCDTDSMDDEEVLEKARENGLL